MQSIISKIDVGDLCHGEHYYVQAEQPGGIVVVNDGHRLRYLAPSQYTTLDEQRKLNEEKKIQIILEQAALAKTEQRAS